MATKVQKKFLAQPVNHFYMLLVSATALTFLGIVMVFSASTIHAIDTKGSATSIALRQLLFVLVSIPIATYLARLTVTQWNLIARFGLSISLVILGILLIPGVGKTVNGNTNWIDLKVFDIQPSEFAKFFMILWASRLLAKKRQPADLTPMSLRCSHPDL